MDIRQELEASGIGKKPVPPKRTKLTFKVGSEQKTSTDPLPTVPKPGTRGRSKGDGKSVDVGVSDKDVSGDKGEGDESVKVKAGVGKKRKASEDVSATRGRSKGDGNNVDVAVSDKGVSGDKGEGDKSAKVNVGFGKKRKASEDVSAIVSVKVESEAIKKRAYNKKVKEEVVLTHEQKDQIEYENKYPPLLSRTVPASLFATIRDIEHVNIKQFMTDIGFSSLYSVKIETLPARLGRFAVESFNLETYEFKVGEVHFIVTPHHVRDMLGIPMGGTSLFNLPPRSDDDAFVMAWLSQFDVPRKKLRPKHIAEKLLEAREIDWMFKLNFLMLFANVMGTAHTMKGLVDLTVVKHITRETDISQIDWCDFVYNCLAQSVVPNTATGFYIGPLCFLILLYLDSTKCPRLPVIRLRPAIQNWTSSAMHIRQDFELKHRTFGKLEFRGEWTEAEAIEAEGFIDLGEKAHHGPSSSSVTLVEKQSFCDAIEKKLSAIGRDKIEVEKLLKDANAEFPDDEDLRMLYDKYAEIFKDFVSFEDMVVHIDDLDNVVGNLTRNVDAGNMEKAGDGGNVAKDVSEKVKEKENFGGNIDINVSEKVKDNSVVNVNDANKEKADPRGENMEKAVVNVNDANKVDPPGGILEVETFTQWINTNIDWYGDVIDTICEEFYADIEPYNSKVSYMWPGPVPAAAANIVCPKTPPKTVTRSSPKKKLVSPTTVFASPYMNLETEVKAQLTRLEFVLGNSIFAMRGDEFESVFQATFNESVECVRVNMETLAPGLWIDVNVVDIWAALLNYEQELVPTTPKRHFCLTGCITEGMVNGELAVEEHFKVFSSSIDSQFRNGSSTSLSEFDQVFFPVCVSGHFYVVVFYMGKPKNMIILDNSTSNVTYATKYKPACDILRKLFSNYLEDIRHPKSDEFAKAKPIIPKLKWATIQNHVDCGVFAMMHMEHFHGENLKTWDIGVGLESKEQEMCLRKMRYKIAAKILLNQCNRHFVKMYKLAYEFEQGYDHETRVSMIVDAINNRDKRDPRKSKNDKQDAAVTFDEAKAVKEAKAGREANAVEKENVEQQKVDKSKQQKVDKSKPPAVVPKVYKSRKSKKALE